MRKSKATLFMQPSSFKNIFSLDQNPFCKSGLEQNKSIQKPRLLELLVCRKVSFIFANPTSSFTLSFTFSCSRVAVLNEQVSSPQPFADTCKFWRNCFCFVLLWSFCFLLRSLWTRSKAERHVHGTVPEPFPRAEKHVHGTIPEPYPPKKKEKKNQEIRNPYWELCWNPCRNLCENKGQNQTNVPTYQSIYCCMYCISQARVVQPLFLSYVRISNKHAPWEWGCESIWYCGASRSLPRVRPSKAYLQSNTCLGVTSLSFGVSSH